MEKAIATLDEAKLNYQKQQYEQKSKNPRTERAIAVAKQVEDSASRRHQLLLKLLWIFGMEGRAIGFDNTMQLHYYK